VLTQCLVLRMNRTPSPETILRTKLTQRAFVTLKVSMLRPAIRTSKITPGLEEGCCGGPPDLSGLVTPADAARASAAAQADPAVTSEVNPTVVNFSAGFGDGASGDLTKDLRDSAANSVVDFKPAAYQVGHVGGTVLGYVTVPLESGLRWLNTANQVLTDVTLVQTARQVFPNTPHTGGYVVHK
jgi:hypothetical protein